ncbi:hypothetical protein JYU34_009520 [Plutella xylostella]|uniref:PPIase cyclophilin-type domain-containing protein n=1 Tax=Plutella xylostella TaxID=51655 RepID=A0ABQ7QJP9_PLUXY|nr:hypothetical protein JYU34_009520 [Plutella xylostella]
MNPLREKICDVVVDSAALATPPPEPVVPKPPKERKPKEYKIPEKPATVDDEFYAKWANHQKELQNAKPRVSAAPPAMQPERYLQPRRLQQFAQQLHQNVSANQDIIKKIHQIQTAGGYVDCRRKETDNTNAIKTKELKVKERQRKLDEINKDNNSMHVRIQNARSKQPGTAELNKEWEETKRKIMKGANKPFVLFKTERIDKNIHDPAFDKPPGVYRPKVKMELSVRGGTRLGRVTLELFSDLVPDTCRLFLSLVKGTEEGHAYTGTRIFRIVAGLYCRGGDVTQDNGYGSYVPSGNTEPFTPENFDLKHTVPGVVSMSVSEDDTVDGHFNIIFKPLPQLDGKNVVFGRIIAGPSNILDRVSALGLPPGCPIGVPPYCKPHCLTMSSDVDVVVSSCGYFSRTGAFREGAKSTIEFGKV